MEMGCSDKFLSLIKKDAVRMRTGFLFYASPNTPSIQLFTSRITHPDIA